MFVQLTLSSHRQAWALVSVIGGGNSSCSESTRDYENHSTRGKAEAGKVYSTLDGQRFAVKAYSEWKVGKYRLQFSGKDTQLLGWFWLLD